MLFLVLYIENQLHYSNSLFQHFANLQLLLDLDSSAGLSSLIYSATSINYDSYNQFKKVIQNNGEIDNIIIHFNMETDNRKLQRNLCN
jgi:hypothetical protein